MRILQSSDGNWHVLRDDGEVLATLPSHAEAWRWIDRNEVHDSWMSNATADRLGAWRAPETGGKQ